MLTAESKLVLPNAPTELADDPVKAWLQPVTIDTYDLEPPDGYPAYLDRRVYQGSSGRVYPLPFYSRVGSSRAPRTWQALHIENEYVRLMVLPELGGRIHFGLDKTRDYDFFYRNNVIKPALVGVTGPWLSGGVEFNWPQHHRPATYLPVDWTIEEEPDGSRTIWCADLDPFARMKGMHGIRLTPGSSLIELRVRLVNRTEDVQTFLWWANVAAAVGDDYQSFFPTDVHVVADHAKRAVTTFPQASGSYYGVDYSRRVDAAHPDADRIDWYRNIPVPTSYMCLGSADDFFGGYDHGRRTGFVHWADHHISPGKKQWTWGNSPFGWAWDRNLTDADGPYVELMAGVYTDNQPDFSFLAPGETKAFSQYWYPIQDIGPAHQATRDGAVSLEVAGAEARVGFVPTRTRSVTLSLHCGEAELWREEVGCAPGTPVVRTVPLPSALPLERLTLTVSTDGEPLISWTPRLPTDALELPAPADEPPAATDIPTVDELYLTGLHLEQYRHATRSPEPYWLEALRRDPGDVRTNVALAARRYRDGLLDQAEAHLRAAVTRLTRRNPNPYDGEALYRLGLTLLARGDLAGADLAFGKAAWNQTWAAPAGLALARIAGRRGDGAAMAERALAVLSGDAHHGQARALAVLGLRRSGREQEAADLLETGRCDDPLDWWLADLAGEQIGAEAGVLIDIALEYASCGALADAHRVLDQALATELANPVEGAGNRAPLILLHQADLYLAEGDRAAADEAWAAAAGQSQARCFPGRLADALMLARLRGLRPEDPTTARLHGHWLYAHGRFDDAVAAWELVADDPVCLRNRGVAAFNVSRDPDEAVRCYDAALVLAPGDARLWYERDQLAKRLGEPLEDRLSRLEPRHDLVLGRDDLAVEYVTLLQQLGRSEDALAVLNGRVFQPWEGGEGQTLDAWEQAHLGLAADALRAGDAATALDHVQAAFVAPANLGEDRHPLANTAHLNLALGDALHAAGREEDARVAWEAAAAAEGDFVAMATTEFSERSAASITALQRLGRETDALRLADRLAQWAKDHRDQPATIDYFATSLPTLLLFHENLQTRQQLTCDVMTAQAALAAGRPDEASRLLADVLAADPSEPFARAAWAALTH
jgi:tetratricopeptide (TPR) repeat protein